MSKYVDVDRLLDGIDDYLLKFDISEAGEFGEGYATAMCDVSKLIKDIQLEETESLRKRIKARLNSIYGEQVAKKYEEIMKEFRSGECRFPIYFDTDSLKMEGDQ